MSVLPACMPVSLVYGGADEGEEGVTNGVVDGGELPCRCWVLKQDPQQEQQVFSNDGAASSATEKYFFFKVNEISKKG